jgi:hypothetical protein
MSVSVIPIPPLPSAVKMDSIRIQELLQTFMVAKNLTADIRPDLEAYSDAKKHIKYTASVSSEILTQHLMDDRNTDFDHIPLVSIASKGGIDGNGIFCRLSIQHTTPETLYVSFRPLNIEGLETLSKTIPTNVLNTYKKYTRRIPLNLTETVSLDNLIHLVQILDNGAEGVGANGLNRALETELQRPAYEFLIENWFQTLIRRKAYQPYMRGLLDDTAKTFYANPSGSIHPGTMRPNTSLLEGIMFVLRAYKPASVVFTGFSLGASLAAAASYLCHRVLTAEASSFPIPVFHLYQYAGVCVGDMRMNAYIRQHFETSLYVTLTRKFKEIDPVSFIARGTVFPIGNIVNIDVIYHQIHSIQLDDYERLGKVSKLTMHQLVFYYLLKMKRAEPFTGIHLAGEATIERILVKELIERGIPLSFLHDARKTNVACAYFTSTGYSAKYRICPKKQTQNRCKVVKNATTKRVQCVEAV